MRRTIILNEKVGKSIKSLALNVQFKNPELGMKDYEILSRATAFLLNVDPSENTQSTTKRSPHDHLESSRRKRDEIALKQDYAETPAGGPPRLAEELGWLEFCPGSYRPVVHVVASSHVLSPWLWKNYYPQPWLEHVKQEHVAYSVEVFQQDSDTSGAPKESLAKFALNPYPIHHPGGMDLAIIHLKQEDSALKQMKSLGVQTFDLTHAKRSFEMNDEISFEGFKIAESHYEEVENINASANQERKEESTSASDDEDTRIFMPYTETGNLIFANQDRFLATTENPLPEGLCGGPVIDVDDQVCGIVEGIVPVEHEDKRLAGAASFIPHFQLRSFLDHAEKIMLEQIVPKNLFDKVVDLKAGKGLHQRPIDLGDNSTEGYVESLADDFQTMVDSMRKAHSPEQIEAILGTVEREREEVLDALMREGGDVDEVIAEVRARTRETQRKILEELSEKLEDADILGDKSSPAK